MKQIGIIGAGASGLCALKNALALKAFSVTAWEIQTDIGGTWLYNPRSGTDEYGLPIHSSMYTSLRTNLPKEIMRFPDFPFPPHEESYIRHFDTLNYLKCYAKNFDLYPHIKFRHKVEAIEPISSCAGEDCKWRVLIKNLADSSSIWNTYDILFICNGHLSVPYIPNIPNIDTFSGITGHSHNYREPSPYKDLSVAVLGARSSGLDISIEIASVAKEVFVCHNLTSPNTSVLPSNVTLMKGIKESIKEGFILMDGSSIRVDRLLYCTGYEYSYPFLASSCGISIKNRILTPLYKHLVNAAYPSMFFIGINSEFIPFPFYDIQVRYCLEVCSGSLKLPSSKEMMSEIERNFQKHISEYPAHHFHQMGDKQWDYLDDLSKQANLVPLEKFFQLIYNDNRLHRKTKIMTYQRNRYSVTGPDSFSLDCRE